MARMAWLTDIHLNFLESTEAVDRFLDEVARTKPVAVLLGGDIAEARDVASFLTRIDDRLSCRIFFVLGNHDFYYGSIGEVRQTVQSLCHESDQLVYLTLSGVQRLTDHIGLIGHDGWADGRAGNFVRSPVMLNDYNLIGELVGADKARRLQLLNEMGDAAAEWLRDTLPLALHAYRHVYFLTHVPPMHEACWHEGHLSDDDWAPHFCSVAVGRAMLEIMSAHPDHRLTVLCGHTHSAGQITPLPNVTVITGAAQYGAPAITEWFPLEPSARLAP